MTKTIEQIQAMKYDGLIDSLNCCVSESINDQAIKAITTLQAELEKLRKDAEWQPIETAPKDGTRFLVVEATKRPFVALWLDADHPDVDDAGWYDHWNFDPVSPTHWKPLPKPPVTDAAIDKAMESATCK